MQFTGTPPLCGAAGGGAKERAPVLSGGYQRSREGCGSNGENGGNAERLCSTCRDGSPEPIVVPRRAYAGRQVPGKVDRCSRTDAAGFEAGDRPTDARRGRIGGALLGCRSPKGTCATDVYRNASAVYCGTPSKPQQDSGFSWVDVVQCGRTHRKS